MMNLSLMRKTERWATVWRHYRLCVQVSEIIHVGSDLMPMTFLLERKKKFRYKKMKPKRLRQGIWILFIGLRWRFLERVDHPHHVSGSKQKRLKDLWDLLYKSPPTPPEVTPPVQLYQIQQEQPIPTWAMSTLTFCAGFASRSVQGSRSWSGQGSRSPQLEAFNITNADLVHPDTSYCKSKCVLP